MPLLPTELWVKITDRLVPQDLLAFVRTHRSAQCLVGQDQLDHLQLWDSVFKSFDWVDQVRSLGLIPVLICQDKEPRPYVYLFLAKRTKETIKPESSMLNIIEESLRSQKPGKSPCEIEFNKFTLNISDIMWPECPILSWRDSSWFLNKRKHQVAVYNAKICKIRPENYGKVSVILIPGYDHFPLFQHTRLREEFGDYGKSG